MIIMSSMNISSISTQSSKWINSNIFKVSIRCSSTQSGNWVTRNVSESLDGVNMLDETKMGISKFFGDFYTELESITLQNTETRKENQRDTSKKRVFELLIANRPQEENPLENKDKVELQRKVEELSLTFKEADIFHACPDLAQRLVNLEFPSAKEYLRSRKLSEGDLSLLGEMGSTTIEGIIIHVICTLFTPNKTDVRLATLIEQLERAVRTHAGLMKNQRLEKISPHASDTKMGENSSLEVDSNILTDRSSDEVIPSQEIKKFVTKKAKKYPFGSALVEMLGERHIIEMLMENPESVRVKDKPGHYYSKKPIRVSCNFD